ncbi:MAG: helix-turn-helix domain-containing protein [Dehalococcoidia bacterium]
MPLRLRAIRESQFLTQRELAAKAGLGIATIVRVEKGQQAPTFRTIKRLAAALGVEPAELVQRAEEPLPH